MPSFLADSFVACKEGALGLYYRPSTRQLFWPSEVGLVAADFGVKHRLAIEVGPGDIPDDLDPLSTARRYRRGYSVSFLWLLSQVDYTQGRLYSHGARIGHRLKRTDTALSRGPAAWQITVGRQGISRGLFSSVSLIARSAGDVGRQDPRPSGPGRSQPRRAFHCHDREHGFISPSRGRSFRGRQCIWRARKARCRLRALLIAAGAARQRAQSIALQLRGRVPQPQGHLSFYNMALLNSRQGGGSTVAR